ncbi:MAG: hypothetical protein J6Y89_09210 [Lachnospiraceae bacterium]|nr:hypothetical protein [Lachnospiraceae bacterium]
MPHSSGGGSSGGGFHGGSSGGGSSNHISNHYFAGARRYRRFYTDGRPDEYIYANSKPGKTGLSALVILAIMGIIFMGASLFAAFSDKPEFIVPKYSDDPAIYDDVGLMEENEKAELLSLMKDYNKLTGICPVVYTTFDEEWNDEYTNLEKYTFDKYVSNFSDEQHWVFVYSIPVDSAQFQKGQPVKSSEFMWEAVQGDETDLIITESAFDKIGNAIQNDLKAGKGPAAAFITGFNKAIASAKSKLNPNPGAKLMRTATGLIPFIIVAGIFIPLWIFTFKSYKKEKTMDYEEVPLDVAPAEIPGLKTFMNASGGTVTEYSVPGSYHRETSYSASNPTAAKVVKAISLVVIIPFILIGVGITAGGVSLLGKTGDDRFGGIFMIGFGIVWTIISLFTLISLLSQAAKAKKMMNDPLTAEYPKAEYPKAEYPDMTPVTPAPVAPSEQPEFDPQFFGSAKSDYESDDEDYKRMKRQGFE